MTADAVVLDEDPYETPASVADREVEPAVVDSGVRYSRD